MLVKKVMWIRLPTAALAFVIGLLAVGLVTAPTGRGAAKAAIRPAAGRLHVAGKVNLGRLGRSVSAWLSEAPNGDVYYARGPVVYVVKGNHAPVKALRASGPVLAVAVSKSDLLIDVGRKVSAYALRSGRRLRTWALPTGGKKVTAAKIFAVGSTVWTFTDTSTIPISFVGTRVDRFTLSSPAVHSVSADIGFSMAADWAGLYYERFVGNSGYVCRALPSGSQRKRSDQYIEDGSLALAGGDVYLLNYHNADLYLDAFRGSTLAHLFSKRVSSSNFTIAGTRLGLVMLSMGKVSLVNTTNGRVYSSLTISDAFSLVPGRSAIVVTFSHSRTYLLRLAR